MRSRSGPESRARYCASWRGVQRHVRVGSPRKPQAHPRVALLPIELRGWKPIARELRREPRTWGEHVRRQRMLRGLRQKDLAVAHGISVAAIHNWERGHAEP